MRNRWCILAVLFAVRLTIAFQFQSVAAVAPLLGHDFGVGLAEIGLLIGLYFTPGVVLSLPGGAIGQRFGDKSTALGALALMLAGSFAMALTDSWSWQIAGGSSPEPAACCSTCNSPRWSPTGSQARKSQPRWRSSSVPGLPASRSRC